MKLVTFTTSEQREPTVGVWVQERIFALKDLGFDYRDMNHLIDESQSERYGDLLYLEKQLSASPDLHERYTSCRQSEVKLWSPIVRPKQDIICLGLNYADHVRESRSFLARTNQQPDAPIYFSKRANQILGHGDQITSHADVDRELDYEVELAVIIGKDAFQVGESVGEYIFGYSVFNDISARHLQHSRGQWYLGKSLDSFSIMGPCIVTADEFAPDHVFELSLRVNDQLRQHGTTDQLIHDVDSIIRDLTRGITLIPGSIISTGTPEGVGAGFNPPKFLRAGDKLACEIKGIGKLENTVAD